MLLEDASIVPLSETVTFIGVTVRFSVTNGIKSKSVVDCLAYSVLL